MTPIAPEQQQNIHGGSLACALVGLTACVGVMIACLKQLAPKY